MSNVNRNRLATRVWKRAARTARKVRYNLVTDPSTRRADLVGKPERWEAQRRFQFEFLTSHGLQPEHRLLDIGCGTLRGGIPFIEYLETGHYTGIEARAGVLKEGRRELADSGLEHKRPVLINAADPARVQLPSPFDFAWAFMALIHMPDEVVDGYLGLASSSLAEGGQLYGERKARRTPRGQLAGLSSCVADP